MSTFAAKVSEHYCGFILPNSQKIEWSKNPDPAERMRLNAEKLKRWVYDGYSRTGNGLIDIEESFIAAFPDTLRWELQVELANRQGLFICELPEASADMVNLGHISTSHGMVIIALAPIFEDGVVDQNDKPHAKVALAALDKEISRLMSMRALIERETA